VRCHTANVADKAAIVHVPAGAADTDNVSGRCNAGAGGFAQRNIFAAGGVKTERPNTDSSVGVSSGVANQRAATDSRVATAGAVANEGLSADTRIGAADSVVKKYLRTDGYCRRRWCC